MSGFDSVLESLRDVYAAIGEAEVAARNAPGDRYVLANIASLKEHAAELEEIWQEACHQAQKEVCRYRMLPNNVERYSISSVTQSLYEFQQLFSRIFDATITGQPKKRGRISQEIFSQSEFDFAFSYPGSLGVVLTVQGEPDFFGDKFEESVRALLQITEVSDDYEIRDLSKKLGGAVVKKAYDWSRVNLQSQFDIGIRWSGTRAQDVGRVIPLKTFDKLVSVIEKTTDVEPRTFSMVGTLLGISVHRNRFDFYGTDERHYSGGLSEKFDKNKEWAINHRYRAEIEAEVVTEYATQEIKETFRLTNLTDQTA